MIPIPAGTVDLARWEIRYRDGTRCALSKRQVELLDYLACKAGSPVARDELLAQVWRLNPARVITRTVDMHVSFLRRKLRDDATKPAVLMTVNGAGYMLANPKSILHTESPPDMNSGEGH